VQLFLHQYVIEVHLIYKSLLGPHYFLCQLAIPVMAESHLWGVPEVLESPNETFFLLTKILTHLIGSGCVGLQMRVKVVDSIKNIEID
jgi:hypothetical protein